MATKISALRPARNGRSVRVILDSGADFSLPPDAAADLDVGAALDADALDRLERAGRAAEAYSRCLGLLARRPRARTELERYLRGRGLAADEADGVLQRLAAHGWVDDAKFAREWVENRQTFRPRSALALRMELRRFGVSADEAGAALAGLNETDAALAAARKRAPRLLRAAAQDPQAQRVFQEKMTAYLASRGFAYDLARETARSIWDATVRGDADAETEP
jgi:regulatory protein